MATYTALSLDEARAIGALYGLTVLGTKGLAAGSVNSNYELGLENGERVFLRIYEEQSSDGAESEAALLAWLRERDLPVPRPLVRTSGGILAEHAGKPVAVFPWLPGEMRCQRSVTTEDTFTVGASLARVHLAGSPSRRESRFSPGKLLDRCRVIAGAPDASLASMAPVLEEHIGAVIAARLADAPRGLCHGDLFRDNVLWQGSELSALLDFESAAEGPFAFDLAVTLLAWTYGEDFAPDLARSLAAGYESVRTLASGDREALYIEARLAALRFATTRITDYAMRAHLGANNPRDWRRFWNRYERLGALGQKGLSAMLGIG